MFIVISTMTTVKGTNIPEKYVSELNIILDNENLDVISPCSVKNQSDAVEYLSAALNVALQKHGVLKPDNGKKKIKEQECVQQLTFEYAIPERRDITLTNRYEFATYLQKLEISGKLDVNITTKVETCFERLKTRMIAAGDKSRLKRGEDGSIYEQVVDIPYAYVRRSNAKAWLNEIFLDDPDFSSDCYMIDKLEKILIDYEFTRFPRLKCDRLYIGFRNGVVRIDTCEFTPRESVAKDLIVRKYFESDLDMDATAPIFDSLLRHQFSDDEIIHMFYNFLDTCERTRLIGSRNVK